MTRSDAARAAVYLRISSDRTGDELGVTRQREDVQSLIDGRGWSLAGEYVDNDTSAAGKRRRPAFEALLGVVRAKQVDIVVAWALDRLARTARDRLALIDACRDAGVMIALARGSDIDPTTPAGRLTAGVLGEVAQHEIDAKSDRQRRAAVQAAQQGRRIGGRRPFGYGDDGMTVRDDEAAAVRRGYQDLFEGVPLARIARDWNAQGFRTGQRSYRARTRGEPTTWRADAVRRVLSNPRNAGIRAHLGEEVGPALWPALVDVETFRAACAVLADPGRNTGGMGRAHRQLLTGIGLCGVCGATVHGGGASHGKPVYRCTVSSHLSRLRDPVDDFVTRVIVGRLGRADAVDLLVDHDRPDAGALRDEAAMLRARLDSLATEFADGELTASQLRTATERLRARLAEVQTAQAEAGRASILSPLVAADDVAAAWDALDVDRRRAVIDALVVVRLHPPGRGTRIFRPETVEIVGKPQPGDDTRP
ncbi:recombinase family protein [Actinomycetospora sp. CA-101289]|uniref:recombinase family protein n=1 Tax=Actinomycetospora sp. CA-101289 TaxID=3239893 RepID=UPI003D99DF2E